MTTVPATTTTVPAGFPTNLTSGTTTTAAALPLGYDPATLGALAGQGIPLTAAGASGVSPMSGLLSGGTAPQVNATNQSALGGTGGTPNQSVTNNNNWVSRAYSGTPNWGYGYGGLGSSYLGGVLGWQNPLGYAPTAYSAYGASMVGSYYTTPQNEGGIMGWFHRIFG